MNFAVALSVTGNSKFEESCIWIRVSASIIRKCHKMTEKPHQKSKSTCNPYNRAVHSLSLSLKILTMDQGQAPTDPNHKCPVELDFLRVSFRTQILGTQL